MGTSADSSEDFCLRWNDFHSNLSSSFKELRKKSSLFDLTLVLDDPKVKCLQAHRLVLAACSPFFKQILLETPMGASPNPVIYLRGVRAIDLAKILDFIYHGEVNVAQEELNSFLAVAEDLKIKGLTNNDGQDSKPKSSRSYKREAPVNGRSPLSHSTPAKKKMTMTKPKNTHTLQTPQSAGTMDIPPSDPLKQNEEESGEEVIIPGEATSEEVPPQSMVSYDQPPSDVPEDFDDESFGGQFDESTTMDSEGGFEGDLASTSGASFQGASFPGKMNFDIPLDSDVCADISGFLTASSMRFGKAYQCMLCETIKRDWFNMRDHLVFHMIKTQESLVDRLDSFMDPFLLKTDQNITCLLCKKAMGKYMMKARKHFIQKHLNL